MGKKLISYALYGNNTLYSEGAVRNVLDAQMYYPGWICRVYVSNEISNSMIKRLEEVGAEIVSKTRKDYADGMFWRFLPMSENDIDVCLVRDTDAVILQREVDAVNQWLESDRLFHIMRDHPLHKTVIVGCALGSKKGAILNIDKMIDDWGYYNKRGADQEFLKHKIYPIIKNSVMIHTDLVGYKDEKITSFPTQRINGEFIGCGTRAKDLSDSAKSSITKLFNQSKLVILDQPFSIKEKIKAKIKLEAVHWLREHGGMIRKIIKR